MNKKIVITGATGLIGRRLADRLIKEGNEVTIVSRSIEKARSIIPSAYEYVKWDYKNDPADFVDGKDIIIHLMGENIMAKRWTETHKKNVFESRIKPTQVIISGIEAAKSTPSLFIHSSAIGFYGNTNVEVDEDSKRGEGFLADVVSAWEDEAAKVEKFGVRKVSVRLGIVLDKEDGALKKMVPPFKLFIGGPLGSGKQWFPWIHIDDAVEIFKFAIDHADVNGAVNAVAPESINMKNFAETLGKVMRRPSLFRVPEFVLKIMLGESADALIYGAKVLPKRLIAFGYEFRYKNIEAALKSLFK
ncbi:MAG: TIGR01777 family oxidoreductase [Melioribacteraceae bacterium]|nr:TIGR01777 family oxidoreductase [Melioribacteraceae bacterium]